MHWREDVWVDRELEQAHATETAVDSRRLVLARLRAAVLSRSRGPVLVTGEPGAGKTWLSRRLVAALPASWQSTYVALTPSLDALDFLELAGQRLGLAQSDRVSTAKLGLEAALRDERTERRSWVLIVDDCERGAPEVWDEIQVLGDQVGSPGGFAGLLVLSQTQLIRLSAIRRFRSFPIGFAEHHHLAPLDLDEARELVGLSARIDKKQLLLLEAMHRDAAGNPRRLLRLAERLPALLRNPIKGVNVPDRPFSASTDAPPNVRSKMASARDDEPVEIPDDAPVTLAPIADLARPTLAVAEPPIRTAESAVAQPVTQPAALFATKPPLRIEDGLIEVGWDGDLEAESTNHDESIAANPASPPVAALPTQETVVEDPYATLQAWAERSASRQRARTEAGLRADELSPATVESAQPKTASTGDESHDHEVQPDTAAAKIRAEGQHEFAPYSQLFTRLRQSS